MASPQVLSSAPPAWRDFAGSAGATAATLALLAALALVIGEPIERGADLEPLAFAPGALMALGDDADRAPGADAPGDPATASAPEPTPPAEPAVDDPAPALTDNDTPASAEPAALPPSPPKPRSPRTDPSPKSDSDPSNLLPRPPATGGGPGDNGGRPQGDPKGFSDLQRDGDPWATAVLAALGGAKVGTFAGELPKGSLRFKLSVCATGKIDRIKRVRGSTIDDDGEDRVVHALRRVDLPRPPAAIRTAMAGGCTRLDYTFVWTADGVK